MKIIKLVVGQLQTNCYLLIDHNQCLIIDPGDDGDFIINKIKDMEVRPIGIIATHGHFDHILAATELKLAFNIPFYLHKNDLPILKRTRLTAKYFTGVETDPPPEADRELKEGQIIKVGSKRLRVIETPGHTPGGISLYVKGAVFVGDLIFKDGVGRTDLAGGDSNMLDISIKKISELPKETIVYPGHGDEFKINGL